MHIVDMSFPHPVLALIVDPSTEVGPYLMVDYTHYPSKSVVYRDTDVYPGLSVSYVCDRSGGYCVFSEVKLKVLFQIQFFDIIIIILFCLLLV